MTLGIPASPSDNSGPRKLRVLWVVPVFKDVDPKPFANFLSLAVATGALIVREGDKYSVSVHVPERKLLHSAMNQVTQWVLDHDFDICILADDDCGPPVDAIMKLLRRYEAGHPIVLGMGFMRNFPHTTTVGRYFPEGISVVKNSKTGAIELAGYEWLEDIEQELTHEAGLVNVDFGGFPIALIAREVFEKASKLGPLFGTHIDGGDCTHDVYFAKRVTAAGFEIVVDTTIPCNHLGEAMWVTFENRQVIRDVHAAAAQYGRDRAAIDQAVQERIDNAPSEIVAK